MQLNKIRFSALPISVNLLELESSSE